MPDPLIVGNPRSAGNTPVPFEFQDVQKMAARLLQRANEQAQRKLMAAGQQAQDIEKAAYQDGLEKGLAAGRAQGEPEGRAAGETAARSEFSATVSGVAAALGALLGELESRRRQLLAEAESDLLHLSFAVARRILRRELTTDPESILPIVREAVALSTHRADLVARLHPDDIAAVERELPALRNAFTDLGAVRLEADPAVSRAGVILGSREGEVDLRLESQLTALERALAGEARPPSLEA